MAKKKNESEQKYEKILAPSEQEVNRDVLPQNVIKMGEQVLHDKNIYIMQSVYKEIHDFTKDKLTIESGGMLLGYTIQTSGKTNIIIDAFIEGKYSEGTPTTLKFTHDTWDYVHKEVDSRYPDEKILGWIHTHPNFGIFLSNYDKFIQQNFFNDDNQIAYVVDPIQHTEGFFFWINGQIEKCPGFYIYDAIGTEIDFPTEFNSSTTTNTINTVSSGKTNSKGLYLAFGALSILCMIGFIILSTRISEMNKTINSLNEQLSMQNQSLANQVNTANQNITAVGSEVNKHTIIFISDDGTILSKNMYSTGDVIIPPSENPIKKEDEMYNYSFAGWNSSFKYAVNDAVFQAVFNKKLREYTITFEDEKGNVLCTNTYHYGDTVKIPEYIPVDETDKEKKYNVSWDKEIAIVSDNTTYKAVVKEVEESKEKSSSKTSDKPIEKDNDSTETNKDNEKEKTE